MSALLELRDVSLRFGGLTAVNRLSFRVREGQIFSLIGPNGAGKTSVFNTITGIYPPTEGSFVFQGAIPRRCFTARTFFGLLLVALLSGSGLTVLINIETLWGASITENYLYQQAFPWRDAIADLFTSLAALEHGQTVVPFLFGFLTGLGGGYAVWRRSRCSPEVVACHGISRTFQNIRLFQNMTVAENVLVGMHRRSRSSIVESVLRLPRYRREQKVNERRALELLEFVGLRDEAHLRASSLPYGHQRRLEIARALAGKPKLLLLDEPAAGMNPAESVELMNLIRKIRESGVTVLLIEHHMKVVMGISDRIAVLEYGNLIAEGTPEEIQSNQRVIQAYLGVEE